MFSIKVIYINNYTRPSGQVVGKVGAGLVSNLDDIWLRSLCDLSKCKGGELL